MMALECKVKSFEDGILIGEIVNVNADESILTDGKVDPAKSKCRNEKLTENRTWSTGKVMIKNRFVGILR